MDPVSLTASIITLIAASNTTVSGLMRLWDLRHPPAYLDSAINEVTDFKAMLHLVQKLVVSTQDNFDNDCKVEIERLLGRAKDRIDATSTFLERLFKNNEPQRSKQPSLRHRAKFQELLGKNQQHFDVLRQDLVSIKTSLNVLLTTAQLRLAPLLLMRIQSIAIVQPGTSSSPPMGVSSIFENTALIEHVAYTQSPSVSRAIDCPYEEPRSRHPSQDPSTGPTPGSYLQITTKPLTRTCSSRCKCRCHTTLQRRTPRWLRGIFGTFFINSTGTPLLNYQSCDQPTCGFEGTNPGSLHFQYLLPTWLLPFGIEIHGSFKHLRGPGATWSVRVPRILRQDIAWEIQRAIEFDSVQDLQRLLSEHRISIIDLILPFTILEYAIIEGALNVTSKLLDLGFDLDSVDTEGRAHGQHLISRTVMYKSSFGSIWSTHARQLEDSADSMKFNALHRTVTGWSGQDLATEVLQVPDLIHGADALGYTPLHYAAYRADLHALDVLIAAGACVNTVTKERFSVLYFAVLGGSIDCCQKLIDAGANTNFKNRVGNTALAYAFVPGITLLLLENGAEVNTTNDLGETPLMWAARYRSVGTCRHLLNHGAELEAADEDGRSAIFWAVLENRPPIVKFLCSEEAVLNCVDLDGWSLIDYAAAWGCPEVMQVLADARIEGLPMSSSDIEFYWEFFERHRPIHYEFEREPIEDERAAFQALLDSIIPCEEDESDTAIEDLDLPGAFPQETDGSSDEQDTTGDEDEEYDTFEDAVDDQEGLETVRNTESYVHPT